MKGDLLAIMKLLDHTGTHGQEVTFEGLDGTNGLLVLSRQEWEDLDEPSELTVTIFPGDRIKEIELPPVEI
jgi:hypothetical protein